MTNTKKILAGLGLGVVAYFIANKMLKKDTLTISMRKSSADGIDYEDLGEVGDIYAVNDDNFYAVDGEYYSAEGDFMSASGDFYDADGDFMSADGDYLMADGDFMSADGEVFASADGEVFASADDGEFDFTKVDGGDTMSFASGKKLNPKKIRKAVKRGGQAGLRRALANWQRKLNRLQKAKANVQAKVNKIARKMSAKVDAKIRQAQGKIAQIQQRLKNPANQ